MNMHVAVKDPLIHDSEEGEHPPSRFAGYLRILGALAVVGSGVLYMLQGLHTIDVNLRYWIYIALMLVLGAGGIFSYKLVQDRKGARLFFGLAVAMVPVQFSQLGGMVFNYLGGGHGNLMEIFQFASGSPVFLLSMSVVSLVVAIAINFSAFSILCRPHAKNLTLVFAALNLAMLLPVREFPMGLLLIGGMAGAIFLLEKNLFSRDTRFKTLEGISVRAMFLLPLIISMVRSGFHENTLLGASMLTGLAAISLIHFGRCWFNKGKWHEILLFIAYIIGIFASCGISTWFISSLPASVDLADSMEGFTFIAPAVAWSGYISYLSKHYKNFYRTTGIITLVITNLIMLFDATAGGLLITCLLGSVLVLWGVREKARLPVVAGVMMSVASVGGLLLLSFTSISINVWLALAIAGVLLVGLSSVLEKYGRQWVSSGREHLIAFSGWNN